MNIQHSKPLTLLSKFGFNVVLILILFSACKKEVKDVESGLRPNYIDALVDSNSFKSFTVDSVHNNDSKTVTLIGLNSSNTMTIQFPDSGSLGDFPLSSMSKYNVIFGKIGSIIYISKNGTLNLINMGATYEGSFNCTAVNLIDPNDSVIISDGKFKFSPSK